MAPLLTPNDLTLGSSSLHGDDGDGLTTWIVVTGWGRQPGKHTGGKEENSRHYEENEETRPGHDCEEPDAVVVISKLIVTDVEGLYL